MRPLWQLARPADLYIREWEDAGVAYDAANGNTHLLDPLALELLALLRAGATAEDELIAVLASDLPDALGDPAALVKSRLEQLARLGLTSCP